jgi:hypothetical protein
MVVLKNDCCLGSFNMTQLLMIEIPSFQDKTSKALDIMSRYRNTLRVLATPEESIRAAPPIRAKAAKRDKH